jgi:hypothetical protein
LKKLSLSCVLAVLLLTNMDILERFQNFMSSRQQTTEQRGGAVVTGTVEDARPKQPEQKPVDYTDRVWFVESSRGKLMEAPTSSAKGHFQFIDRTWDAYVKKHNLDFKPEDRFDFEKSKKVFELFTQDNVRSLRRGLGRDPTYTEKYMAHKLGPGTAVSFMKASPNATVDKVVGKAALRANRNVFYNKDGSPKRVKEVYSYFNDFFKPEEQ